MTSTFRLRNRLLLGLFGLVLVALAAVTVAARTSLPVFATGDTPKVTLCHATGSEKNPFVQVTVDAAGAFNGHLKHADDIIPPFEYQGKTYSLNWPFGKATFDNGCVPKTIHFCPEGSHPDSDGRCPPPCPAVDPVSGGKPGIACIIKPPEGCPNPVLVTITGTISADGKTVTWLVHNKSSVSVSGTFKSNGVTVGVGFVPANSDSSPIVRSAVTGLNTAELDSKSTVNGSDCPPITGSVNNPAQPPAPNPPPSSPPASTPPVSHPAPVNVVLPPSTGDGGCRDGKCG